MSRSSSKAAPQKTILSRRQEEVPVIPDWVSTHVFRGQVLRRMHPLPIVKGALHAIGDLKGHDQMLFLILSDLMSNALEHGVLRLETPKGENLTEGLRYQRDREKAFESLRYGLVIVELRYVGSGSKHRMIIRVEDSGIGFDHGSLNGLVDPTDTLMRAAHGLNVIREICTSITYYGRGNIVEAIYEWDTEPPNQGPDH